MRNKGVTLLELVISMGIFSILATLVVGGYVVILNMKGLTSTMKETQQKLRVAIEITSRFARQASSIDWSSSDNKTVVFYQKGATSSYVTMFKIETVDGGYSLFQYNCKPDQINNTSGTCNTSGWEDRQDLLSDSVLLASDSSFTLNGGGYPPTLRVYLHGKVTTSSPFYSDEIGTIDNTVILEGIQ